MLDDEEINNVFQQYHFDGMGCVSHTDAHFLCDLIQKSQPKKCFEVGVASGMSSTFILMALAKLGSERKLVSVDISQQYYADKTKQVGYVVESAIPKLGCKFDLHFHQWSADAETLAKDEKFDFVFIDAHHGHPWPTLDTMLVLPFVKHGTWIAHHDIALKDIPQYSESTGPFHVYQSFPEDKVKSQKGNQNIGAFQITDSHRACEEFLLASLAHEWTLKGNITEAFSNRIFDMTERYYSDSFAKEIRLQIETHNQKILAQRNS